MPKSQKNFLMNFISQDLSATQHNLDSSRALTLSSQLINHGVMFPLAVFRRLTSLLTAKGSSLGNEKWTVLERVLLVSIKLDIEPWIGYCLKALRSKFPGSSRVERLVGLYREAKEDWIEAESIYKGMLNKTPENMYARKRMVACLKSQGRISDAIHAIIDQLEIFSTDSELWHELTMLYMSRVSFSRAAHAFEEVVLADPKSFYNLVVYAEILASNSEWVLARKYYCKSLEYRPNEPRALWGLLTCLVETSSSSSKNVDPKSMKVIADLMKETKKRLIGIYSKIDTTSALLSLKMLDRII